MHVGMFMCVQEHVCVKGHVCEQVYMKDMGQLWVLSSGTVHLFKDRASGWPLGDPLVSTSSVREPQGYVTKVYLKRGS